MREDIESIEAQSLFSETFLQDLNEILCQNDLATYSPMKFYWTTLIDNFVYISQLHQDLSSHINKKSNKVFQKIEEEILDFWNDSDLVNFFKAYQEEGQTIEECSLKSMRILEDHVISFYYLQISTKKQVDFDKAIYLPLENIGDNDHQIYLRENKFFINLPREDFALLSLEQFNLPYRGMEINLDEQTETCKISEVKSSLIFNQFKLIHNINSQNLFSDAFKIIELVSIDLLNTVQNFSETFVLINEPGIVSFSMQGLPAFSSINVFERDFLDLIDDIIHENGHHYLNAILNQEELINEDDEKIYFSPWRQALRPIRGIYHATFTFYFALQIFCQIKKSFLNPDVLAILKKYQESKFSLQKINKRIVEEYEMLGHTRKFIDHAYKKKKITLRGYEVISWIYELIDMCEGEYKQSIIELKEDKSNDIFFNSLNDLNDKIGHYSL